MAGYTRRSSAGIVDGGIISADDLNDEFNALETSMGVGGHSHNGQAGEGPQIDSTGLASASVTNGKLASNAVTGNKIDSTTTITAASFVGPVTGSITGDVTGDVTGNADTATTLATARNIAGQSFDGSADISIATTDITNVTASATEVNVLDGITASTTELNYVDGVTSSIQTQINGKQATITGAATTIDDTDLTASRAVISDASGKVAVSGVTTTELDILDGATVTTTELNILDGVTSTATELNILDGATATTTELNILDGDTTATSTTLVDADRVVVNDAGTMKQVAMSDVKTYTDQDLSTYAPLAGATFTGAVSGTDLTLSGTLTVNGDTTTLSTTNTLVEDNLMELNSGATANANDSGIIIERGTTGDNAVFIWDESLDKFALGTTTAEANSTGDITYTPADLVLNNIVHEGTADAHETTIAFTDPTGDRTITFPDAGGTVALTSDLSTYALLTGATFSGAVSGTSFSASSRITTPEIKDDGTSLTIESDTVEIRGTSDESTVNVSLISEHLTPADNDVIGRFYFRGPNSAGGIQSYPFYAKIEVQSSDVSDGTEDGSMFFSISKDGSLTTAVTIDEGGTDILGTLESDGLKIGAGSTVNIIRDEDDMTSDDASALATQQSIKAYVDSQSSASSVFSDQSGSAPFFGARAYISFKGTLETDNSFAGTIYGSGNIDSVTRTSAGKYTINFTTDLPNTNYIVVGQSNGDSSSRYMGGELFVISRAKATDSVDIELWREENEFYADSAVVHVVIFG